MAHRTGNIVTPLPAVHCVHYRAGRCCYEEWQNPGMHAEWVCKELQRFTAAYEHFLGQLEAVRLADRAALKLWCGRLENMVPFGADCPAFVPAQPPADHTLDTGGCAVSEKETLASVPGAKPASAFEVPDEALGEAPDRAPGEALEGSGGSGGSDVACMHAEQDICLLLLPACGGICPHYRLPPHSGNSSKKG